MPCVCSFTPSLPQDKTFRPGSGLCVTPLSRQRDKDGSVLILFCGSSPEGQQNVLCRCGPRELSLVELQDPFLVSVHIITDPGQATPLQRAADALLSCIHPELLLFRVSERGTWQQRHKRARAYPSSLQRVPPPQPALALILFLQEGEGEYGGEEQLSRLHRALQRPPWQYHHTERVNGRLLPLAPCSQDFFTLAPGTPLWAVRQVHYGKEIVRFTVYCRHQTFSDMVAMYRLLLRRPLAQRREDFCFFVVYSNPDTEIQLSFKRLPRGQNPAPTEAAILEFRVRDVGGMVPLLPHPCTPISEARWQTEDYDGNKILLQPWLLAPGLAHGQWSEPQLKSESGADHCYDNSLITHNPLPL
ncbi:hypothetical protein JZ751_027646 [Albula glossodonta]|uniref:FAM124 domain-containing protein n=1 Tax=Albula glossodonta TaxID=121402 RepID=A0A8T2P6Q5_9TELE|nr:hypothetical protein JZ751_027646 [Albula glossodonta]